MFNKKWEVDPRNDGYQGINKPFKLDAFFLPISRLEETMQREQDFLFVLTIPALGLVNRDNGVLLFLIQV